jgi:membrane fusion protein, macrolide-specific efflux system
MKKSLFTSSLIAILAISGMVAVFLYKDFSRRPEYAMQTVKKGDIQVVINFNGTVQPQDKADLGFEVGGKITELKFTVGDYVSAGTILAKSSAGDLEASYRQAVALADSARANLEQYQALENKAEEQLDSLKKSSSANSDDRDAQREQIKASQAQVVAQEASVRAASAAAQSAQAQLAKKIIVAPFAGIISRQDSKAGEVFQTGSSVLTLISRDAFKVEAYVSELDVRNIKVGDKAQLKLDDNPEKIFESEIIAIDPAESSNNGVSSYKVTLNLDGANAANLRSGVGVSLFVVGEKKDNLVVVPLNAVFEKSGKKMVYISQNGLRVEKEVKAGIYGQDAVEIISGLKEGDQIFVINSK